MALGTVGIGSASDDDNKFFFTYTDFLTPSSLYLVDEGSEPKQVKTTLGLGVAVVAMLIAAQMPPDFLRRWTPWGYLAGLVLLVLVLLAGISAAWYWRDSLSPEALNNWLQQLVWIAPLVFIAGYSVATVFLSFSLRRGPRMVTKRGS